MSKGIIKRYSNGELTVIWKPEKCIHSGICVNMLPDVYDPEARPWITPEHATKEELINQIKQCPSGALSYQLDDSSKSQEQEYQTEIQIMKNGPLIVQGILKVKKSNGEEEIKSKSTAFCRCGSSENKPYCDGSHRTISFQAD